MSVESSCNADLFVSDLPPSILDSDVHCWSNKTRATRHLLSLIGSLDQTSKRIDQMLGGGRESRLPGKFPKFDHLHHMGGLWCVQPLLLELMLSSRPAVCMWCALHRKRAFLLVFPMSSFSRRVVDKNSQVDTWAADHMFFFFFNWFILGSSIDELQVVLLILNN